MIKFDNFIPPFYLRNAMIQTFLSSSSLRKVKGCNMILHSKEVILDAGKDIKLLGFYSRHPDTPEKGTIILLHGWEGSSESAYIHAAGRVFFDSGYNIFRLNFRDHGDSHHLNKGPFLGTLIDEAVNGIRSIAERHNNEPVYIVGFSMGGNFAVRIAKKCSEDPIKNLKYIVAINPALDPKEATINIDNNRIIKSYFLKKWKRSLRKKQDCFPDDYDFSDILQMNNCMDMTEILIKRHTPYKDATDYFSHYNLTSGYLDTITIPTLLITSKDDPIIPVNDFLNTPRSKNVNCIIHTYGGHCGYITGFNLLSWYHDAILRLFSL